MAKYIMTCKLNFYESKKAGKIAIVTMDNGQSYNVPNTWGVEAFESLNLSLIHISEPTRLLSISYAVFCLKKKKKKTIH